MRDRPASQLQHWRAPIWAGIFMLRKIARDAETSGRLQATQIFVKCRIFCILTADEPTSRPTRAKEAADARDDRPCRARAFRRTRLPRYDPARHRGGRRRLDANDLRL